MFMFFYVYVLIALHDIKDQEKRLVYKGIGLFDLLSLSFNKDSFIIILDITGSVLLLGFQSLLVGLSLEITIKLAKHIVVFYFGGDTAPNSDITLTLATH